MCLLFFKLNEGPKSGPYRLVLANNRDEFWDRPTATAAFWGKDDHCLSSLDKVPNREGGTWIGMSKHGKVGVLLNIGGNLPGRKGRGFLVSNFLNSYSSAETHLQDLTRDLKISEYNAFHLVLLEVGSMFLVLFSGGEKQSSLLLSEQDGTYMTKKVQPLSQSEVHAIGNSEYSRPWQKVVTGKLQFQKIIEENNSLESKDNMIDALMGFLNDKTPHFPDHVLERTCKELGYSREITQERSAWCVWSPAIRYGTRTTTVIVVDWAGNCEYIERSLITPVQANDPQTTRKTFKFNKDKQIHLHKNTGV